MSDLHDPAPIHSTTTAPAAAAATTTVPLPQSADLVKSINHRSPSHLSLPSPPLSPQQDRPLNQHHPFSHNLAHLASDDEDLSADSNLDVSNLSSNDLGPPSNSEQLTATTLHAAVGPHGHDLEGHALEGPLPVLIPVDGQQQQQRASTPPRPLAPKLQETPPQDLPILTAAASLLAMDDYHQHKRLSAKTHSDPLRIQTALHSNAPTSFAAGIHPLHGDNDSQAEISPSTPLLPSQWRKHHESLKLKARQEQAEMKRADAKKKRASSKPNQQQPSDSLPNSTAPCNRTEDIEEISVIPPLIDLPCDYDDNDSDLMSPTSYHAQGALIRAKSYSMFESTPHQRQHHHHHQQQQQQQQQHAMVYGLPAAVPQSLYTYQPSNTLSPSFLSTSPPPAPSMDTRDWVKMQARINSLEQQVTHVSRTNQLLNQELDKVNGHLDKLTHEEGEGWRREYEFLVHQVDMMRRQLSNQYIQHSAGGLAMPTHPVGKGDDGTNMTRMLQREVRDLSDSLRKWQTAYKEADERYRKKLDGERALKQTLQEREAQMTSLVDKLSGYEREVHRSLSNYEELMRLSHTLQVLEGRHPEHVLRALESAALASPSLSASSPMSQTSSRRSGTPDTAFSETSATSPDINDHEWTALQAQLRKRMSAASFSPTPITNLAQHMIGDANVDTGDLMPGTFPVSRRNSIAPTQPPPVDHLSVSILSWAALLATYMMS